MIDIKLLRQNPDLVRENIKKKFQDDKLTLVDEILDLDVKSRQAKLNGDELRAKRKILSNEIGSLMREGKNKETESIKLEVQKINQSLEENETLENKYSEEITNKMMRIPNIMHESVPIGEDDSKNIEIKKYGEPIIPDYEIPFHGDILENLGGLDLDSARRVAGQRILLFNWRYC